MKNVMARNAEWRQRLIDEMIAQNIDKKNLSIKAGLGDTYIRDALERNGGRADNLKKVADALGVTFKWLMTGEEPRYVGGVKSRVTSVLEGSTKSMRGMPEVGPPTTVKVLGEVAAGRWMSVSATDLQPDDMPDSPFPPERHYPAKDQFDLVVRGTSINRFARDGERLRCVNARAGRVDLIDNDIVIVERRRFGGELVETTAKRLRKVGSGVELWPDSDDEQWQTPIRLGADGQEKTDETVNTEIVALVLYAYDPVKRPARTL